MKKNQFSITVMCLAGIFFTLLFIGCGGGGGGGDGESGGDTYTGATEQIKISEGNTQPITEMTLASLFGETAQLPFISGAVAEPSNAVDMSVHLERFLIQAIKEKREAGDGEYLTGASTTEVEDGDCGGTMTISGLDEERVGNITFSGSVAFDSYCECGFFGDDCENKMIFDGEMSVSGKGVSKYDEEDDDFYLESGQTTFRFDKMTAEIYENSSLAADLIIDGSVENSWNSLAEVYEETMKMDLIRTDMVSGKATWMKDLTISTSEDWYEYESTITINGRIYYEDYGFIDIQTLSTLLIDIGDSPYPYQGTMVLSGDNGSKIRITFWYDSYLIESDVDGDGVYEYDAGGYDW